MHNFTPSLLVLAATLGGLALAVPPSAWIGGGKPILEKEDKYKMVVQTRADFWCTGTFLNDTTLITANHCVGHDKEGKPVLKIKDVAAVRVFENETFLALRRQGRPWAELGPQDVVLAVFPKGTAEKLGITTFGKLAPRAPFNFDKVTMVGFGINDVPGNKGLGVKRWGENQIREVGSQIAIFGLSVPMQETGVDATGANGDSGGPLLNREDEIVGITSWGTMDKTKTHHWTYYSNVRNWQHEKLYRAAIVCDNPDTCAKNFPNSGVTEEEATKPREKPKPKEDIKCVSAEEENRLASLTRAQTKGALSAADDEERDLLIGRLKNIGACDAKMPEASVNCLAPHDLSSLYRLREMDYREELAGPEQDVLKMLEDRMKAKGICE